MVVEGVSLLQGTHLKFNKGDIVLDLREHWEQICAVERRKKLKFTRPVAVTKVVKKLADGTTSGIVKKVRNGFTLMKVTRIRDGKTVWPQIYEARYDESDEVVLQGISLRKSSIARLKKISV